MPRTDGFTPMPRTFEILAQSSRWDPFGHRWGKGSHWPLLASIGTRRFRSAAMRQRRREKESRKREERAASGAPAGRRGKGGKSGKGCAGGPPRAVLTPAGGPFCAGGKGKPDAPPPPDARPLPPAPPPPPEFVLTGWDTARWSGYDLTWGDGAWCVLFNGAWWRLEGPHPARTPWQTGSHRWVPS
ncbi:MAG: hypothetical protein GY772_09340 [bacterium]|nr:hypothetical protein [bacterium]